MSLPSLNKVITITITTKRPPLSSCMPAISSHFFSTVSNLLHSSKKFRSAFPPSNHIQVSTSCNNTCIYSTILIKREIDCLPSTQLYIVLYDRCALVSGVNLNGVNFSFNDSHVRRIYARFQGWPIVKNRIISFWAFRIAKGKQLITEFYHLRCTGLQLRSTIW